MLAEVGCIIAGIPLGYALRNHVPMVRVANGMASGIIYVLLFLLGISLGSNEQLLTRLGELGVQGFAIGFGCALGSVAVTAGIAKRFFQLSTMQGAARADSAPPHSPQGSPYSSTVPPAHPTPPVHPVPPAAPVPHGGKQ